MQRNTYNLTMSARFPKKEIGNLVIEGIPEIPIELSDRLDQYQNIREATLIDWLPDGQGMLIATRFGESTQFHIVRQPGGLREQVTFFSEPVYKGAVCSKPGVEGFWFAKDSGGNEAFQLYFFDLKTGKYHLITDGSSRNDHGVWDNAGERLAFSSTRRNGVDHDLYICKPHSKEKPQLIMETQGYWYPMDWSPDNEYITLAKHCSMSEHHLYIFHPGSGNLMELPRSQPDVSYRGGIWAKDGKGLFYTSDEASDYNHLYYFDLFKRSSRCLTSHIHWDIEGIKLSPDGRTLAFVANENGISILYLMDAVSEKFEPVKNLPIGVFSNLCWLADSSGLGFSINRSTSPSDVYAYYVEDKKLIRWTYSETGGLDVKQFVEPSLIHYPTFDKHDGKPREIPAYLFMPTTGKESPLPVLIYIHGGPESQFRPEFSSIFQYYLNELHIAVLAPNVRGSTGYGKHFLKLDNGYQREDSVYDIGKLLDWIELHPNLDASRIAVMGGSYGGYMVLASMTHFNQRLRCGIDIVGISNFVTFLENTQSYRRDLRRLEYGDERDPSMRRHLERISPTANAHKITKPMLIVQGLNDPRVPASEAEQMIRAIRKNGGEAWYLLAKDEGHGFRKKSNRDFYTKAVILFLQRFLLLNDF